MMRRERTNRWLGPLNFYLLRWTLFRLACVVDETGKILRWTLIGPVWPSSGYDGQRYRYVFSRWR